MNTMLLHNKTRVSIPKPVVTNSKPWDIINSIIHFRNPEHQFWWDRTGRMLAKLLEGSGYSPVEQYRELFFYALYVAPELGAAADDEGNPMRWPSPTTADNTPIDFSWEWGLDGNGIIRYSFEPIGHNAGTALDPLNTHATEDWVRKIQARGVVPCRLEWYDHFKKALLLDSTKRTSRTTKALIEETTVKAGTLVAIDMEKSGPVMKVYWYPCLKALELGMSSLELCIKSIRSLPEYEFLKKDVEPLFEYLKAGTERWGFDVGVLGTDLIKPEKSRIKLYVRAPHTTVEFLMDAITMGGRISMAEYSEEALADLKDFWNLFLDGAQDPVPDDAPARASPGFYYSIKAGTPISAKIYLSPYWTCGSDADVLSKLRNFFTTRGGNSRTNMQGQVARYENTVEGIFGKEVVGSRCGSQYYLTCALQKNRVRVVTYLSPQTFECEKDAIRRRLRVI